MNYQEGTISVEIGHALHYISCLPIESRKAVVQIVHGYAEHSGRYESVLSKLVPAGYAVYVMDLYGHGKSDGERGHVDSYTDFIQDQLEMNNLIREKEGADIPIFMLGHSLGAMIATHYASIHQATLDGLILSGAGMNYSDLTTGKSVLVAGLSKATPKRMVAASFPADRLSSDPAVVKAFQDDPLVFAGKMSLGLLEAMRKLSAGMAKAAAKLTLPVLIQKGGSDTVVLDAEELFVSLTHCRDKTYKLYEGLKHEVYNEVESKRGQVLDDLLEWLDSHI
jgi:alpha-beta hydrolase superfamily lysophospholipase